jgi:hypothetical protein
MSQAPLADCSIGIKHHVPTCVLVDTNCEQLYSNMQVFELAIQRHALRNCWALEMRSLPVLVETDHLTPLSACP